MFVIYLEVICGGSWLLAKRLWEVFGASGTTQFLGFGSGAGESLGV